MHRRFRNALPYATFLIACACSEQADRATLTTEPRSIIASIGNSGIVTFDKVQPATPGSDRRDSVLDDGDRSSRLQVGELAIPITVVQSLHGNLKTVQSDSPLVSGGSGSNAGNSLLLTTEITATVYGVSPPALNEYHLRMRNPREDDSGYSSRWDDFAYLRFHPVEIKQDENSIRTRLVELVLSPQYVARLQSKDQLKIQIQVQDSYEDSRTLVEREAAEEAYSAARRAYRDFLDEQWEAAGRAPSGIEQTTRPGVTRTPNIEPTDKQPLSWIKDPQRRATLADNVIAAANTVKTKSSTSPALRTRSTNASRTITVLESTEYRTRRLANNIPIYDISAFPLSSVQARYLFGDKIERLFYVVGISIQNNGEDNHDRVINSGMIRVYGQALIRPSGSTNQSGWFTVPVSVAPQSREHVYTVLDDEEPNEPRAIFFRSLEFAGTLATAIVTGFDGSEDAIKALGIYTGIGIPEGKKLVPDRWPGYKRNVVNYAMPNLVKVGRGTSSPNYFLFFSKTRLEGMVLDSQLFKATAPALFGTNVVEDSVKSDSVNVATLSFDAIEVPFEIADGVSISQTEPRVTAETTRVLSLAVTNAESAAAAANAKRTRAVASKQAAVRLAEAATKAAAALPAAAAAARDLNAGDPELTRLAADIDTNLTNAVSAMTSLQTPTPRTAEANINSTGSLVHHARQSSQQLLDLAVKNWQPPTETQTAALARIKTLHANVEGIYLAISSMLADVELLSSGPPEIESAITAAQAELDAANAKTAASQRILNDWLKTIPTPAAPATPVTPPK